MSTNIFRISAAVLLLTCLNFCDGGKLLPPRYYNKYYYDPYQDTGLLSENEEMCSLPMATLRTILRGLVAVLTRVFPECALPEIHGRYVPKEEPIKVFRQIMACPTIPMPYYPTTCCTPRTQIPPPPTMPTTFMHTQL